MRQLNLPLPLTLVLWLLTCCVVTYVIDRQAVSPLVIQVEDFRRPGMTDEQVIAAAAQHAGKEAQNWWWIRNRRPLLEFSAARSYNFDPVYYHTRARPNAYAIGGHTVEFANHPR